MGTTASIAIRAAQDKVKAMETITTRVSRRLSRDISVQPVRSNTSAGRKLMGTMIPMWKFQRPVSQR